jgi:hypothetical protein
LKKSPKPVDRESGEEVEAAPLLGTGRTKRRRGVLKEPKRRSEKAEVDKPERFE